MKETGISHENAKMEDKQDKVAQHGEDHHVGRSRGRGGRGNYGRECGIFHQQGASTSEQSGEGTSAWIATAHAAQSNYSQGRLGNEIQWLLDSR